MRMSPCSPLRLLALVAALVEVSECRMEHASQGRRLALRSSEQIREAGPTCSTLHNRGTYFTIDVYVGTPAQKFSVVADTGSNLLIVQSCVCQAAGICDKTDKCFTGTNHSSTFSISHGPQGPVSLSLTFGSGTIHGVVAKDYAQIGALKTFMKDGLLLMTDHALNFGGPFEGILGLGLPSRLRPAVNSTAADALQSGSFGDIIQKIMDALTGRHGGSAPTGASQSPVYTQDSRDAMQGVESPKGFLEQARVGRFSMCFNYGSNGTFRLGIPEKASAHGGIGSFHWGLDFRGISVGDKPLPVHFCSPDKMRHGQTTPCAAIPDSGTTLITGPDNHVHALLEGICDEWPRCRQNHTALVRAVAAASKAAAKEYGFDPFGLQDQNLTSKAGVLKLLLADCESWLDEGEGLDELPPVHFHVRGSAGTNQSLALPGQAYVIESELRHANHSNLSLLESPTFGERSKVCSPAFGVLAYETEKNGPVWILGTAFFYAYVVGYNMDSEPPSISFTSVATEPCGSCSKLAGLTGTGEQRAGLRRPRWISGPVRPPTHIDTQQPL
mmetsp:Transcript_90718/g.283683  ORF Transcript_90718/g.283683 Transcript_90718/m.283683 type:complete len:556 (-) Transcript_90718:35-1702(-)